MSKVPEDIKSVVSRRMAGDKENRGAPRNFTKRSRISRTMFIHVAFYKKFEYIVYAQQEQDVRINNLNPCHGNKG